MPTAEQTPPAHTTSPKEDKHILRPATGDTGGDPIIGIDLGTTNSLVAWCDAGGPRILPDEQGRNLLPSVVRFDPASGSVLAIGHEARAHGVEYPRETVFSIKRLMGRGVRDLASDLAHLPYDVVAGPHETARVRLGQHIFSPQEVSAVILKELKRRAELFFKKPVHKAVITVPAYFDDAQRQATRDAGRIAGLEVVRIVNEPTASSLAYNLGQQHHDATIAVYDLGGGTFDVSILRLQRPSDQATERPSDQATKGPSQRVNGLTNQRINEAAPAAIDQVLATSGDTHLGGDDVDQMIVELIQREIRQQFGAELEFPPGTRQAFRNLAEAVKIQLSDYPDAEIEVRLSHGCTTAEGCRAVPGNRAPGGTPWGDQAWGGAGATTTPGHVYSRRFTRVELETMIAPWVERTINCCAKALHDAHLTPQDIERIVLVGGSSRMPLVRRRVAEFFGREPYTALNPDEVIALGAAVQGAILSGVHRGMLLLDVIPLSLGIETLGGAVAKLITANSAIPARATEMFTTYVDGQTSIKLHVVQGERELVRDCRSLGAFHLRGVPPMPAGLPKVEVTFLVDANGVLSVSAVEQRSLKAASIQIVPNHGLTRAEVAQMEAASLKNARADMAAHRLIDLRNQARMDMRHIARQLERVGADLPAEYRQDIEGRVALVQRFIDDASPDPDAFHKALDAMDKATVHLAEVAIKKTLAEEGK